MSRTAAQDFAQWRALSNLARNDAYAALIYDPIHKGSCSASGDKCPCCAAVAVLRRAARRLAVKAPRSKR